MRRTSDRLEVEIKDNANNQCRSHRTQRGMPSLITLVHAFLAGGQASASVIDILGKAADYAIAPISAVAICQMPPQCRARIQPHPVAAASVPGPDPTPGTVHIFDSIKRCALSDMQKNICEVR